jgi:DNA-binding XRE family transcriptional regulator
MTVNPEEIIETRTPTPAELATFIKAMHDMSKWTQATLAEIAGLTERTVQRVENGEPSSLDTRRALARAFGCKDLDIFDKPWPLPNVEKLKTYSAELDKTVLIPITRIRDGRTIRTITEGAFGSLSEELGEVPDEAREAFASLVDSLRDYNDVRDLYSMSQRLEVDRQLDDQLKIIGDAGAAVGAGLRTAKIRLTSDMPNREPMDWTNVFFILASRDALPAKAHIPKSFKLE